MNFKNQAAKIMKWWWVAYVHLVTSVHLVNTPKMRANFILGGFACGSIHQVTESHQVNIQKNTALHKNNTPLQTPDNTSFITFGKNSPDMNCQPPKIVSSSENFPWKSGERFVVCGVPSGEWVKKFKNFGGLISYSAFKEADKQWDTF